MMNQTTATDGTLPIPTGSKGRPLDVRGAHAVMTWEGRTLLGTVMSIYYTDRGCAGYRLRVRFNNGEMWPIEPYCSAVRLLDRTVTR